MNFIQRMTFVVMLSVTACTTTRSASDVKVGRPGTQRPQVSAQEQVSPKARLLFEDANKAYEQQRKSGRWDYAALERKYRAAADADGIFAEPLYNLGVLAERQGRVEAAAAFYREALSRKPTLRQAAENLAVIAQNSGDIDGAIRVYQDIQANYPDDASSRARLAEVYRQRGDSERAIEMAREALFREPKNLTAYKVMLRAYADQKQYSMARLVALRALALDDSDAEIHFAIGLINMEEKDEAKARVAFKKAVELRSDYLPAHIELARLALEQENYVGAEESLRRILQKNGKNAEVMLNLGVAYKGLGQLDKAMQSYDDAQKLNPNLAAIYLNRGIVVALKGDPTKAKEYYRQYLSMAGGEESVDGNHPVFQLIRDADAVLLQREQEKQALEEAARIEEEARKAEEAAKAEEKARKEEEFLKQKAAAKGGSKPIPSPKKPARPSRKSPQSGGPDEEPM